MSPETLPWFAAPALALAAGLLALAPLGRQVLQRGVVFIDLAVAQAAAAAALWAAAWMDHPGPLLTQACAACGALTGAALVRALARRAGSLREASIGLVYVFGAGLAMLGARHDPHGAERLGALLAADLLWAGWPQAAALAAAAAVVQLLHRAWPGAVRRVGVFYTLFALVASLAVPVLGLFVVFAALVGPAMWMRRATAVQGLAGALAAGALGLAASWWFDGPSGVAVTLALAAWGLLALARAPSLPPHPGAPADPPRAPCAGASP